jgi:hypothetical protein
MEMPKKEFEQLSEQVQNLCDIGQNHLSRMQYLEAEHALSRAETAALSLQDWDALSRLYMPLQEARRQRRQRSGEGAIHLDYLAKNANDSLNGPAIVEEVHQGQTLIAGWASILPGVIARDQWNLYVDVFVGAVYPMGAEAIVAIIPDTCGVLLPPAQPMSIDALVKRLPPHTLLMTEADLRAVKTYADTMALWEKLHSPFLAAADATIDPIRKIAAYRQTIRVDYACELAHQRISDTARALSTGAKQ